MTLRYCKISVVKKQQQQQQKKNKQNKTKQNQTTTKKNTPESLQTINRKSLVQRALVRSTSFHNSTAGHKIVDARYENALDPANLEGLYLYIILLLQ